MNLVIKEKTVDKYKQLSELEGGECFSLSEDVWIKARNSANFTTNGRCFAINVKTGEIKLFVFETLVLPADSANLEVVFDK